MRPEIPGYTIIAELHRSPFSTVYRALHIALDRTVLIKVLPPSIKQQHSMAKRFVREAKVHARLAHPNIVQIFDYGVQKDAHYIIMEFIQGRSLRQLLQQQGALEPSQAVSILRDVLRGLSYAHDRGVLHRDIKPENIMISDDGEVKITDFGLAAYLDSIEALDRATVGTPAYMAPEQIHGQRPDQRSDLFSVGAMFFEMLTGRSPFVGETIEESIHRVLNESPALPPTMILDIPEHLQRVCLTLLQKDAQDRFANADEALAALEAKKAPPENTQTDASVPASKKRKTKYLFPFALAVTAIGVTAFFLLRQQAAPPQAPPVVDSLRVSQQMQQNDSVQQQPDSVHILRNSARSDVVERPPQQTPPNKPLEKTTLTAQADRAESKTPGYAFIDVQPWAKVIIDSASYGMTPIENRITLSSGRHVLKLINPQFGEIKDTIDIKSGETIHYKFNFNKMFGRLQLQVRPWADIYLNGRHYGATPISQPLLLKPGTYRLRLVNPGYTVWEKTITINADETLTVQAILTK